LCKICQAKLWLYERSVLNPIPWYARYIHLRISIYITWVLLHTNVSANQVTVTFMVVGLIAVYLFSFGQPWMYFWGAILLQVRYLLDSVDGEIARYRKTFSVTGEYLDFIEHYITGGLVFFALGVGLHRQFEGVIPLYLGFSSSFGFILINILYDGKDKYLLHNIMKKIDSLEIRSDDQRTPLDEKGKKKLIFAASPKNQRLWYKLIKGYSLYPGINNVLLLVALLELLIIRWFPEKYEISLFYLLLWSYAFFYPISFAKNLYGMVKQRSLDGELKEKLEALQVLMSGLQDSKTFERIEGGTSSEHPLGKVS